MPPVEVDGYRELQTEGLVTEPAAILFKRVNAEGREKIVVGEAERLRLMTCG